MTSKMVNFFAAQNNLLRRASPDTLCAFLCNSIGSKFVTFQTIREGVNYSIHRINTIPAPEFDLIEFDVNESRIFGLWCNSQGEFNATGYSLLPNSEANWTSAAMELLPERKIEPETDPRQTYCSYIFYPGRFQREVIDRALVMFRRSNNLSDPNASLAVLKDRVCYAVEQEIQNELKDFEVTDDLYIETSFKHWERFYSCCEQYHLKSTQPIGLAMLENVGTVVVIKKSAFSLLRPCQLLEHLMLSGEAIDLDLNQLTLGDDITYRDFADLEKLVSVLALIEQMIPDEDKSEIDSKLQNLEMPNVIVSDLVESINSRDTEVQVCHEVNQEIRFIDKLPDAMISLLRMLRLHDDEQIDDNVTYSSELKLYFVVGMKNNEIHFDFDSRFRDQPNVAFVLIPGSTVSKQRWNFNRCRISSPNCHRQFLVVSQFVDFATNFDEFERFAARCTRNCALALHAGDSSFRSSVFRYGLDL